MPKTAQDIKIEILKQQVEALDLRIKFLEGNWLTWTKDTTEIGGRVVTALLKKANDLETPYNEDRHK